MSATESFCTLLGIKPYSLPKEIHAFIEAELFSKICKNLIEFFRSQQKNYFQLMKFTIEMEDQMLEDNFLQFVLNDILLTEEYTLEGIAQYIDTHRDVVHEVITGKNTNPSAKLLRRAIDLHRSVRTDLYKHIVKNITAEYLQSQHSFAS